MTRNGCVPAWDSTGDEQVFQFPVGLNSDAWSSVANPEPEERPGESAADAVTEGIGTFVLRDAGEARQLAGAVTTSRSARADTPAARADTSAETKR